MRSTYLFNQVSSEKCVVLSGALRLLNQKWAHTKYNDGFSCLLNISSYSYCIKIHDITVHDSRLNAVRCVAPPGGDFEQLL